MFFLFILSIAYFIRPILRGRDIKRYHYEWAGLWVIATHNGYKDENIMKNRILPIEINDYPTLKIYLDGFWEKISIRADRGITPYNLRNCSYISEFSRQKIVWNPVSGEYFFAYIEETLYFNNSLFMITSITNDKNLLLYLLAFMNSRLYRWLMTQMTNLIESGKYAYGAKDKIEKLPIPKISSSEEKEFMAIVDKILEYKEKNQDTKDFEIALNAMVYKFYDLSDKEIKIIEEI
ncbi:TaqI-like C-terminal specificity domain-containing protein [Helicobacter sp. 11S03491-1]|uniref:TaqI-like C-terminal specificity domain-containing protein n=1 Tax=Helicobacter sp. 11S03491-1 TaxID=1476196 RepID=UPI000BCA609D|nr:TaqI-like C-terminal specificity domain-containing protein [Helicobacter sp. 11S03491-1]PAF41448.1 hypothetical protein BKH45_06920 [Helicobacter sp. 11S03491-1]